MRSVLKGSRPVHLHTRSSIEGGCRLGCKGLCTGVVEAGNNSCEPCLAEHARNQRVKNAADGLTRSNTNSKYKGKPQYGLAGLSDPHEDGECARCGSLCALTIDHNGDRFQSIWPSTSGRSPGS